MGPRGRHTPGDLLLVQPWAVHPDVQSAPVSAWRNANQKEGPAGGDEPDRSLAIFREVEIPRLTSRAQAQVQGPCWEGPIPGPPFGHRCEA
eukprot:14231893-Alexandrium_andersonii.AAC.1